MIFVGPSMVLAALQLQDLTVEPPYLCPGKSVTITFQAAVDQTNLQPNIGGVFSTAGATSFNPNTDYLFLYSGGTGTPIAPTPGLGYWTGEPAGNVYTVSPPNPPGYLGWATYSWVSTVPAIYTTGQIVYINIAGTEQTTHTESYSMTSDPSLSATVTVNCGDSNVNNTVQFGNQSSTAQLIIKQCITNTPTPTPTITNTSTPTKTPTVTPTKTPTETFTNTFTPTLTNTLTVTPTVTPTNTPTNTPTVTPTKTPTVTPTNTFTFTPTPTVTLTNTPTNTPTVTPTTKPGLRPFRGRKPDEAGLGRV